MEGSRVPWRRSGHCFSFGPFELLLLLGMGLSAIAVPVAVLARIFVSLGRFVLRGAAEQRTVDARLPVIRGSLVSARELEILEVATESVEARCPVCATGLAGEETVTCPRCATVHHRDCWDFNGACAVFGCCVAEPGSATNSSSLSPLSPSSPSPFKPAALASSLPDFMVLRRRFRRWFWLMRVQWWSLLLFSCVGAAGFFLYGVGVGRLDVEAFVKVGLHLLAAVAVLWLLARAARYRLESSIERPPLVPAERMAVLLRRVEHSRSMPLLWRAVRKAPWVYGALGVVVAVKYMVDNGTVAALPYACLLLLWGGAFIWLAAWSTARHRAALELVRSRLRGAGKV